MGKKPGKQNMRFEVLTAVTMKFTVFWDVTPYNLVKIYRRFEGTSSFHLQGIWVIETLTHLD
jgi:hypothetical protein